MTLICFDIGGSSIKAAVARDPHALEALGRVATPLDAFEDFVDALARFANADPSAKDAPIAISVTGVIDPQSGIATVANIPCIDGLNLAGELSARLGRPVFVANDADCFALAEAHLGAGKGRNIVFGAILGTGVGGGVVVDGRLLRGAGGIAGEWGHGTIVATDLPVKPFHLPHFSCGCGLVGCVDTVGGARGLERLDAHLHGRALSSLEIIAGWQEGDTAAAETIALYVELVAPPLALIINVLGPDVVPVGGGLGNSLALIERLDAAIRHRVLRTLDEPLLMPAQISVDAGLLGAASLGFSEMAS